MAPRSLSMPPPAAAAGGLSGMQVGSGNVEGRHCRQLHKPRSVALPWRERFGSAVRLQDQPPEPFCHTPPRLPAGRETAARPEGSAAPGPDGRSAQDRAGRAGGVPADPRGLRLHRRAVRPALRRWDLGDPQLGARRERLSRPAGAARRKGDRADFAGLRTPVARRRRRAGGLRAGDTAVAGDPDPAQRALGQAPAHGERSAWRRSATWRSFRAGRATWPPTTRSWPATKRRSRG